MNNDVGSIEEGNNRITKARGNFSELKKVWKIRKIRLQTKIRILEPTVMTMVKCGPESLALRKADGNLLGVFQRNCSGYLTD